MSNSRQLKSKRGVLKSIMATAFCIVLLGIVFSGAAICQTSPYAWKPGPWEPYKSGKYFGQLQKIAGTYRFSDSSITFVHFELSDVGVGPVDLFRIPVDRNRHCSGADCYFFVLVASDHSSAPFLTSCQFTQAVLTHLFNPDDTRFFAFEFSCEDALLEVKVTPSHFMAYSTKK